MWRAGVEEEGESFLYTIRSSRGQQPDRLPGWAGWRSRGEIGGKKQIFTPVRPNANRPENGHTRPHVWGVGSPSLDWANALSQCLVNVKLASDLFDTTLKRRVDPIVVTKNRQGC